MLPVEQLKSIFWKQDIVPVFLLPLPTLLVVVVADAVPAPVVPEVAAVDQLLQSRIQAPAFLGRSFFYAIYFMYPESNIRFSGKSTTHSLTLQQQDLFSPP